MSEEKWVVERGIYNPKIEVDIAFGQKSTATHAVLRDYFDNQEEAENRKTELEQGGFDYVRLYRDSVPLSFSWNIYGWLWLILCVVLVGRYFLGK